METKNKEILSLGLMCWTKMLIKRFHQQESYPFDSIDSQSIDNVHTVINDLLTNKLDYEKFVQFDENNCNHYGLRFPHHNPPPVNQQGSNFETFKRRLLRFKSVYENPLITKLFIFFNRPIKKQNLAEYENIVHKADAILKLAAGEDNQFLIINNVRETAIDNHINLNITQVDFEFYSTHHDENNVKAHLEYKSHFIPAYEKAKIPDFLLNFLNDNDTAIYKQIVPVAEHED
jgi:hypothetical protein